MLQSVCSTRATFSLSSPFDSYDIQTLYWDSLQTIQFFLRVEQVLPVCCQLLTREAVARTPTERLSLTRCDSLRFNCFPLKLHLSLVLQSLSVLYSFYLYSRDAIEHRETIQFYRGKLLYPCFTIYLYSRDAIEHNPVLSGQTLLSWAARSLASSPVQYLSLAMTH